MYRPRSSTSAMNSRIGAPVLKLSRKPFASFCCRGFSLDHRQDGGSHADENHAEQQQEQAADHKLSAADGGVHDGELAHERPEGRRAGDGQESSQEQRPRQRQIAAWPRERCP